MAASKIAAPTVEEARSSCLPVSLPPCRPAGQGASPCARLRAVQFAKALHTSILTCVYIMKP